MPDPYRRSIAELITRYELEPNLRDIYVEGDRDKFLLQWFFRSIGLDRPVVYAINVAVDIPPRLLRRYGGGNRGRVITLCADLEAGLAASARNVFGLVDKDYSELLGTLPLCRYLLLTDYSCMECYALSDRALEKFCHLYLGVRIPNDCFQELFSVLVELFLLRAAKIALGPAAWVNNFKGLCSIEDQEIKFNRDAFLERLVNASAGALDLETLNAKISELRSRLSADYRQQINGHDLVQILSWYAHRIGVPLAIYNEAPLHRGLVTSVEIGELLQTRLFQTIRTWATA
jgi:hypothetical protein